MKTQKVKDTYQASLREPHWQEFWEENGINRFDQNSDKQLFTIDTPPPTISGALHLGHLFSYTQAEVIARYKRLRGFNVRYPMGYDNNGLPTERLVEKEKGIEGRNLPLAEFVRICLEITDQYKKKYTALWRSVGLSIDWRLEYSTISPETQRLAQIVFKELFESGAIYQKEATALYCHSCRTSVAQAEVEDVDMDSSFFDIVFRASDERDLVISTTRPELLPACVAVFVHPDDERYKPFVGKSASTPLGQNVPILADDKVSIDKGTGAVMCCTYGDETDVYWVRKHNLPERILLGEDGKFVHVDEFPEISSKSIKEARILMASKLKSLGAIKEERPIRHAVGTHERCGTPIELIPTKQWFVSIIDKKDELIAAGRKIQWHPAHMRKRYEEWVSGLKWDWCISRERFFGVPIPAYTCPSCGYVHIPDENAFPIDPKIQESDAIPCPKCGEPLIPEKGVLDTWFTSALTPDLNNDLPVNGKLSGKLYPLSMRPQGHDIIRTWVVYSVLMGLYRHQDIPWKELMISGHILLRKGEKISKKTGGGKYKPEELIRDNSADAIRYTMYGASLGRDGFYDEQEVKKGKRLITKLYNAGKLIIGNLEGFSPDSSAGIEAIDRWIISRSCAAAKTMAAELERYEYSKARQIFEDFFWNDFCDNYLEIVKGRLYADGSSIQKKRSAQNALHRAYLNSLVMISPFLPHIAEEMFHAEISSDGTLVSEPGKGILARIENIDSIHLSSWPSDQPDATLNEDESKGVDLMLSAITEVRKHKTSQQMTMGAPLSLVTIKGTPDSKRLIEPFLDDLACVAKAEKVSFSDGGEDFVQDPRNLLISL